MRKIVEIPADPSPQIAHIELQPIHAGGELVAENWREPPASEPASLLRRKLLFVATVVLPVAIAAIYLALIASDQYVSETRFMVRGPLPSDASSLASLMTTHKLTRASDETYAIGEYLTSREAARRLEKDRMLSAIFSGDKADPFNRFPNFFSRETEEARYRHWRHFVEVTLDFESGIATLRTRAFTPDDALALNKALLADAQDFVNQLNDGVFADTLSLAKRRVDDAHAQFADVESRLADFRNRESVIDPARESAEQLERIGDLMSRLSQAESELARQTMLAPRGPQVAPLASDIEALRGQFDKQRRALSGARGSLAAKFAEFDKIMLDRVLASKALEIALDQMRQARHDREQQHYYLQPIVRPNLPDQATYPRRLIDLLIVAGVCFCLYLVIDSLRTNLREHRA